MLTREEAKGFIIELRRLRSGELFEDESTTEEQKKAYHTIQQNLNKALEHLSDQLYHEEFHFVFELIQNADDNEYNQLSGEVPEIRFSFKPEYVLIENNEDGFEKENVEALCSVGQSTKRLKPHKIGEKGIGFKSVFKVTGNPHVFSNNFSFHFRRSPEDKLSYIVPHWVEHPPIAIDPNLTTIYLPIDGVEKSIDSSLRDAADPAVLLFLRILQKIEIRDDIQNHSAVYTKQLCDGITEIYENNGGIEQTHYWQTVHEDFPIPDPFLECRDSCEKHTRISLAFPLTCEHYPLKTVQKVYAFLPIRNYGFPFILQADFLLTSNREDILEGDFNQWLLNNVPDVFLNSVEHFKQDPILARHYFAYIPSEEAVHNDLFKPVITGIREKLKESPCVPAEDGSWVCPSEVIIADEDIRALITSDDLLQFMGKHFISTGVPEEYHLTLQSIGVNRFTPDSLLEICNSTSWLHGKEPGIFIRLFEYLSRSLEAIRQKDEITWEQMIERIRAIPIIPVSGGKLLSPDRETIFLSLSGDSKQYGFEEDLHKQIDVLDHEVYAQIDSLGSGRKHQIITFLKELRCKSPDSRAVVENYIIPTYKSGQWEGKEQKILNGHIFYLFDNREKILQVPELVSNLCKHLRSLSYSSSESDLFCKLSDTHISARYGNEFDLERLLGKSGAKFIHPVFLEESVKHDEAIAKIDAMLKNRKAKRLDTQKIQGLNREKKERKRAIASQWLEFFKALGGTTGIIFQVDPQTERNEKDDAADENITYKRRYNSELKSSQWASIEFEYSNRGYYIFQDWISDDLTFILERISTENDTNQEYVSKTLFEILRSHWDTVSANTSCSYYYHKPYAQRWASKKIPSSLLLQLKQTPWILTNKGTLAKPSEVFLFNERITSIFGDALDYLAFPADPKHDAKFLNSLGVRTNVEIPNVLSYVSNYVKQPDPDINRMKKLYQYLEKHMKDAPGSKSDIRRDIRIYLPKTRKKVFSLSEVFWKPLKQDLGEIWGSLEDDYPELYDFFVNQFGVEKEPTVEDMLNLLQVVAEGSPESGKAKLIQALYREINERLKDRKTVGTLYGMPRWKEIQNKPIFLTTLQTCVKKESQNYRLYVNDDDRLFELFKECDNLRFLDVPSSLRGYSKFIEEMALPRLSKKTKTTIDPITTDNYVCCDEELSQRIQRSLPYILGRLHFSHEDEYKRLKNSGILQDLTIANCKIYETVGVVHHLEGNSAHSRELAAIQGTTILIAKDIRGNPTRISKELVRCLELPDSLDAFIASLLERRSEDEVKQYAGDLNVPSLPKAERDLLYGLTQIQDHSVVPTRIDKSEPLQPVSCEKQQIRSVVTESVNLPHTQKKEANIPESVITDPGNYSLIEHDANQSYAGEGILEVPLNSEDAIGLPEPSPQVIRDSEPSKVDITSKRLQYVPFEPQKRVKNKYNSSEGGLRSPGYGGGSDTREQDNEAIGRAGEELIYYRLIGQISQEFPEIEPLENSDGFVWLSNNVEHGKLLWHNKSVRNGDRGKGHDIYFRVGDHEEYIEVKTSQAAKDVFPITTNEWELANEMEEKYVIYRVSNLLSENPTYTKIVNPVKLWKEGQLTARIIELRL